MVLDRLGTSLKDALKKLAGKTVVDRAAVEELVKDLQRALIQADVNVKLVMRLSQSIKTRALEEEPAKGMSVREHVLRIVYQELVDLMGPSTEVALGPQTILMAGLQGSGKTTTTAKLARFFQRKGLRVAVIGADTFRPGAFQQLATLCQRINVPCIGDPNEKDARRVVREGLARARSAEVVIIDTQGRHGLEDDLIQEIIDLNEISRATHRWLVIDASLGQAREMLRQLHSLHRIVVLSLQSAAGEMDASLDSHREAA